MENNTASRVPFYTIAFCVVAIAIAVYLVKGPGMHFAQASLPTVVMPSHR